MARTSTLSEKDLEFIRTSKLRAQALADQFGLSKSHIHYLRRRPAIPAPVPRQLTGDEIIAIISDARRPIEIALDFNISVSRVLAFKRAASMV